MGAAAAGGSPVAAERAGGVVRGVETIWATGLDDETGTWPATEPATVPELALLPAGPADAPVSRLDAGWAAAGGAAEATGRGVGFTVGAEGDTEAAGAVEATAPRDSLADGD